MPTISRRPSGGKNGGERRFQMKGNKGIPKEKH